MPTWDFVCSKCEREELSVVGAKCDPDPVTPECCGEKMEILWRGLASNVEVFEPFETRNIHPEGKLLRVHSKTELSRLSNLYKVIPVDDPNLRADGKGFVKKGPNEKRDYFDYGK